MESTPPSALTRRHLPVPGRIELRFFSDNAAAAHPKVIDAIAAANRLDTAYDGDEWSKRLDGAFSDLFGTAVEVLWTPSGTSANCLALAALCQPHGAVICHREAHINNDEAGAPGFYLHGAKLLLAEGPGAKLTPDAVEGAGVAGIFLVFVPGLAQLIT